MKITFLGTGGGRWVVLRQLRASGGFVLGLENQVVHVDPGPGALVRAKEYGVDLCKVTAVLVSHRHHDHLNDAVPVIECMTRGATEKRGVFASSRRVIEGDKKYPPALDYYHKEAVKRLEVMKPGDSVMLGKVRLTATPTRHGDEKGLGFVFDGEGLRIGYTGDGEYFPGMEKHFGGCDYLIMNVLRPRTDSWPGHMNSEGARKLVSRVRPKKAIMKHLGMKMLRGVAEREAAWIEKETGVRTVVARDGMAISHGAQGKGKGYRTLEGFMEENGD
jgi:phosphoribosyl 1,2-cyclic phosphodiesterase